MPPDLHDADHSAPVSGCAEKQVRRLHFPHCWCCLRPGQCLSVGQLGQNFGTQTSNDPLRNKEINEMHHQAELVNIKRMQDKTLVRMKCQINANKM